jgi:peptidoglycan/LPS O-acetylase OafA/YrhL
MDAGRAVQCFYLVSGFLISLVLSDKYDARTAEGRWLFYSNRALRIFVPYWSFCLFIILLHACIDPALDIRSGAVAQTAQSWPEMTFTTRFYLLFSNLFIITQEWAIWLTYQDGALVPVLNSNLHGLGGFQVIPQAWSMSLELMFYALAPFLLRLRSLSLAAIIVCAYTLRALAYAYGLDGTGYVYRFFPFEIGLFLAGVLSHRLYAQLLSRDLMRFSLSLAVSAAFLAMILVHQYVPSLDNHALFVLIVPALPALFDIARRIRLDRWLGELSYPIYLSHFAVLSFAELLAIPLFGLPDKGAWFLFTTLAATLLVSIGHVHLLDAPLERWRQRRAAAASSERPADSPFPLHGSSTPLDACRPAAAGFP